MNKLVAIPMTVILASLLGAAAFAGEPTTASATFVNPSTHAYVGTIIEDCSISPVKGATYIGVYLSKPFELAGSATLLITGTNGNTMFSTTPRPNGEESYTYEVGGAAHAGCMPTGTKVQLLYNANKWIPLLQVLGTGTINEN